MAYCGVASRRKCEEIIKQGRVSVNGNIVMEMGLKVNPDIDKVLLDGKMIRLKEGLIYIALNKPTGYISSVKDQFGRPTVLDLVDKNVGRVYPVGRLDYDSEGLILLTNDGDLTYKLTHPQYDIQKEYNVIVEGIPSQESLDVLREGIYLDGYITKPAYINHLGNLGETARINITLTEGRNRQVRRMFDYISHPVVSLQRVRIDNILLGKLASGKWRFLTPEEIKGLKI